MRWDRMASARLAAEPFIDVLFEDPLPSALEILVLARAQGPEKNDQSAQSHSNRYRDKKRETAHTARSFSRTAPCPRSSDTCPAVRRSRSAFKTTSSDEEDIAIAAMSGVT